MEVYIDDEAKLTLHGLQQHYVKLKVARISRKCQTKVNIIFDDNC